MAGFCAAPWPAESLESQIGGSKPPGREPQKEGAQGAVCQGGAPGLGPGQWGLKPPALGPSLEPWGDPELLG